MKTNLDPHEIAQTAYALGEEFAAAVDSETRNKYAMDTGNGYTGLISLMAEAATALEQAFNDFRRAGREYSGVFLYEAVPSMAAAIAGFLANHGVNDLTAIELRKLADAAIADGLLPLSDCKLILNRPDAEKPPEIMDGVLAVEDLADEVEHALVRSLKDALTEGTQIVDGMLPAQIEHIKFTYDIARRKLIFTEGAIYSARFLDGGRANTAQVTHGIGHWACYGPPEEWLNELAWAKAFRQSR